MKVKRGEIEDSQFEKDLDSMDEEDFADELDLDD